MTTPSQQQIEEGYKQARLNTRCKALDILLVAYKSSTGELSRDNAGGNAVYVKNPLKAADLVREAKLVEEYMLEGIEPPRVSTIVPVRGH